MATEEEITSALVQDLHMMDTLYEVVQLLPDGGEDKADHLSFLSNFWLSKLQEIPYDGACLNWAITLQDDAVRLTPEGHPNMDRRLNNLGNSVLARFKRLGDIADLEKAIAAHENAVRHLPDGHPEKAGRLSNLGDLMHTRFESLGYIADLEKAITAHEDAVRLLPDGHPDKATCLGNLGNSILTRFERLKDIADLDKARCHFSDPAHSPFGTPTNRFLAASKWSICSRILGDSPLDAYNIALDLLPRVAWLGLTVADRHKELSKIGDVVRDAAAAIQLGQYETALEYLEQGRSIVWGQVLNLRSPVDDLRKVDPDLATRLVQVSRNLEHASTRDTSIEPNRQLLSEEVAQKHRRLDNTWF